MAVEQGNKTQTQSAADQAAMMNAMKEASSGQKQATNFQELMDQIVAGPVKWLSKMTGIKLDSLVETGLDSGLKRDMVTNKSVLEGAANFSAQGGKLALLASAVGGGGIAAIMANAGITAPAVEAAVAPMGNMKEMMGESTVSLPDGMLVAPMPTSGMAPAIVESISVR